MFLVAAPDTKLFAISISKATEQNSNNLQKQYIYKIENSVCAWTHTIEKTKSVCYYCECLSRYNKTKLIFLFCLVCLVLIESIILNTLGMAATSRKHLLDKAESIYYSNIHTHMPKKHLHTSSVSNISWSTLNTKALWNIIIEYYRHALEQFEIPTW